MSSRHYTQSATNVLAASLVALLAACNDGTPAGSDDSAEESDNGTNGEASDGLAAQAPEFHDSTTVSTRGELQAELDSLAAEERDDLNDPNTAFLIEIDSDINTGFDTNGRLSYEGNINLYLRSASDQITLDAGTHSGIIEFDPRIGPTVAEIWIDDLRFENGFLDDTSPSDSQGAAIFSTHSLFILGSDFHNNRSDGDNGGAVSTRADARVENSTFTNNQAEGRGGAINLSDNNDLTLVNSTFDGNAALDGYGGAARGDIVTVENSTFTNNTSQYEPLSAERGQGGAIWAREGGNVSGSVFTGNESTAGGGAIWYGQSGSSTSDRVAVEIENTEFRNNTAAANGSAIFSEGEPDNGDNLSIRVIDSEFENNGYDEPSQSDQDATAIYSRAEGEDIISGDTEYIDNEGPVLFSEEGNLVDEGGNSFTPADHEPIWD